MDPSASGCPHLDLLPTRHVLVHRLTGLHDGLPHIRDDFCHLFGPKTSYLDIYQPLDGKSFFIFGDIPNTKDL